MSGEFEKPKYFNFKPELCAHSRSSLTGCTRCIDACPTLAITSADEVVYVDPVSLPGGRQLRGGLPERRDDLCVPDGQ
jgi:ferredoxin